MSELSGDKLAELVAQRHTCLVQLYKLGLKQQEFINTGEISSLMRLLSAKNQLLTALQAIEHRMAPYHEQDPDERVWSSPILRENCARLATECRQLLDRVMSLERENEREITLRRDRLATQLQVAQSADTARRAYQRHQVHSRPKPIPLYRTDTEHGATEPFDLDTRS